MANKTFLVFMILLLCAAFIATAPGYCQDDDNFRNILKQGLLGAGTGAIASGASGGNAGQGALIGAGTNVIGGALLDAITQPSRPSGYNQSAPQGYYTPAPQGGYYYTEPAPQQSGTTQIIKQGLLGAGTGALASGMSGGNAGKGALIGAGTNVIGGALLDAISQPSQPRTVYVPAPQQQYQQQYQPQYQQQYQPQYQPQYQQQAPAQYEPQNIRVQEETVGSGTERKKIIKKYDASGKLVSEEEIYY